MTAACRKEKTLTCRSEADLWDGLALGPGARAGA